MKRIIEYIKNAIRTDLSHDQYIDAQGRLDHRDKEWPMRLLHACVGMTTEVGELMDVMKKYIFYGKKPDFVNVEEELGDIMWYWAQAMDTLGLDPEAVLTKNIYKLRVRYPEKFDPNHALNRDNKAEREVLQLQIRAQATKEAYADDMYKMLTDLHVFLGSMTKTEPFSGKYMELTDLLAKIKKFEGKHD
jgi:NTP pyrophosphatase (non-canonical NTP hydrolase)